MIVIALILVVYLALPGVARANYLPFPGDEELDVITKAVAVFLVSPLLLTLIIEGLIVILPLRHVMTSVKRLT